MSCRRSCECDRVILAARRGRTLRWLNRRRLAPGRRREKAWPFAPPRSVRRECRSRSWLAPALARQEIRNNAINLDIKVGVDKAAARQNPTAARRESGVFDQFNVRQSRPLHLERGKFALQRRF